jgi:hypothetical protein
LWPAAHATLLDARGAIDALCHRRDALEREIVAMIPAAPWAVQVGRLRCLRGVDTLTGVGLCAGIGDRRSQDYRRRVNGWARRSRRSLAATAAGHRGRSPRARQDRVRQLASPTDRERSRQPPRPSPSATSRRARGALQAPPEDDLAGENGAPTTNH